MDRETRDQYVLVIQAKDMVGQMGGLSGTTSVTVTLTDVNDNPPRFTHSKTPFFTCAPHLIKPVLLSTKKNKNTKKNPELAEPAWR